VLSRTEARLFAKLGQSDSYWLTRTPALTYGRRGFSYYKVTIAGPARDLHSGVFGHTAHKPMTDLISPLGTPVSPQGDILVKGVDEMVNAADADERQVQTRDL
jgi:Cys-Gly metallodipeptidase DUG1